jgi:hypothetical protein
MSFVNTCWIMTLIIGYIIMLISLLLGVVLLLLILSGVHIKVKI